MAQMDAAEIPFPIPERTPHVTKISFTIDMGYKKKKEVKKDLFLSYDD